MRRRTAAGIATVVFLSGVIVSGYIDVDDVEALDNEDGGSTASMAHWVGEFPQADNLEELEHYAGWVLDELGVPAEEQAARYPDGGLMTELDMIWLYLTPPEADKANGLIGQGGLDAAETTGTVSLPTPVGDDLGGVGQVLSAGPLAPPGQMGWEEVPLGYQRIGVPEDSDPANGIRVAVIDTGIDGRHEDLENVVAGGFNCTGDSRGPEGYDIDLHGHGTWIGGLIAAKPNDVFIEGIAHGAALYSEVVFGAEGSASGAMVLCGLNHALLDGADVISASLGGSSVPTRCGGSSVYTNGWCKAAQQAVVVVAAGNDAEDAILHAPANVPGVVTVGAIVDFDGLPGGTGRGSVGCGLLHRDDWTAVFSNWGSTVDVVAPGACELSLAPFQSWGVMSGTSMSTPYVAAVFAAFLAEFPDCRGADAVKAVLQYAETFPIDYDGWPGAFPPPLIRYVDEHPLQIQDEDHPTPCAFEEN